MADLLVSSLAQEDNPSAIQEIVERIAGGKPKRVPIDILRKSILLAISSFVRQKDGNTIAENPVIQKGVPGAEATHKVPLVTSGAERDYANLGLEVAAGDNIRFTRLPEEASKIIVFGEIPLTQLNTGGAATRVAFNLVEISNQNSIAGQLGHIDLKEVTVDTDTVAYIYGEANVKGYQSGVVDCECEYQLQASLTGASSSRIDVQISGQDAVATSGVGFRRISNLEGAKTWALLGGGEVPEDAISSDIARLNQVSKVAVATEELAAAVVGTLWNIADTNDVNHAFAANYISVSSGVNVETGKFYLLDIDDFDPIVFSGHDLKTHTHSSAGDALTEQNSMGFPLVLEGEYKHGHVRIGTTATGVALVGFEEGATRTINIAEITRKSDPDEDDAGISEDEAEALIKSWAQTDNANARVPENQLPQKLDEVMDKLKTVGWVNEGNDANANIFVGTPQAAKYTSSNIAAVSYSDIKSDLTPAQQNFWVPIRVPLNQKGDVSGDDLRLAVVESDGVTVLSTKVSSGWEHVADAAPYSYFQVQTSYGADLGIRVQEDILWGLLAGLSVEQDGTQQGGEQAVKRINFEGMTVTVTGDEATVSDAIKQKRLTQEQYDALSPIDANTVYYIVG